MSLPFNTLCLDIQSWDLFSDANGNIGMAMPPYAIAQDVATAARTFAGEEWYDTSVGVQYFEKILGKRPPAAVIQQQMVKAALTVPGVVRAVCNINSFTNVAPQVLPPPSVWDSSGNPITDSSGATVTSLPAPNSVPTPARQVNGQILFVDVNNVQQTVNL